VFAGTRGNWKTHPSGSGTQPESGFLTAFDAVFRCRWGRMKGSWTTGREPPPLRQKDAAGGSPARAIWLELDGGCD